jgi:hypothetical protein
VIFSVLTHFLSFLNPLLSCLNHWLYLLIVNQLKFYFYFQDSVVEEVDVAAAAVVVVVVVITKSY